MTQLITRSDGITYERRTKKIKYDTKMQIRLANKDIEKLKQYAEEHNLKYTKLVRELIEDFVKKECK